MPVWLQALQDVALISFGLIPISIGFAVMRYRLYDIDVIIRRTLTYTWVAAVLVALYLGGVAVLSAGFQSVAGESGALAVTLSTLGAATFFGRSIVESSGRSTGVSRVSATTPSARSSSSVAECANRSTSTYSRTKC